MKIHDKQVDGRAVAAFKELLKAAPEKDILRFVSITPPLRDGFRPGKIDFRTALNRTLSLLDHSTEIHSGLKELLCDLSLERRLLSVLSDEAIERAEEDLRNHFSPDFLYASMLLSDRDSVFERGIHGLEKYPADEISEEERTKALTELKEMFSPFLSVFQKSGFIGKPEDLFSNEPPNQNHEKVKTLQNECKTLKQQLAKEKKGHEWHKEELITLKSKLEASENKLKERENKLRALKSQNEILSNNFNHEVEKSVASKLNKRLLPWLSKAEKLDKEASYSSDILKRAEVALNRQAESDRRFGTYRGLQQRLEATKKALLSLREAQKEALNPLSELRQIVNELENEVSRLEGKLNIRPRVEANTTLMESICYATSIEDLVRIRSSLRQLGELGLCSMKDLNAAFSLIHEKSSKIYAENQLLQADQEKTGYLPLYRLLSTVDQDTKTILIIDGHNVLHRLPDRYKNTYEEGLPGKKSRDKLTNELRFLSSTYPLLRVELWFDSNKAHDESVCDNLSIHYSGGTGEHRADKRILEQIAFLKYTASNSTIILATADRDESDQAIDLGAIILAPEELSIILED